LKSIYKSTELLDEFQKILYNIEMHSETALFSNNLGTISEKLAMDLIGLQYNTVIIKIIL
jgi:hypothetical protein